MSQSSIMMNAARDEYERQLRYLLAPLLYQGVQSIYEDARENSTKDNVLRTFQELLLEIPKWNSDMIEMECKRMTDTCDWLYDLVTAVFVINVKILTSVKLNEGKDQFNLKMPTMDAFIHGVYIEIARGFFHNTHLMYYETNQQKHKQRCKAIKLIQDCISDTIRSKLPIQSILQEYMYYDPDAESEVQSVQSASEMMNTDITNPNGGLPEDQIKQMVITDAKDKNKFFQGNEEENENEDNGGNAVGDPLSQDQTGEENNGGEGEEDGDSELSVPIPGQKNDVEDEDHSETSSVVENEQPVSIEKGIEQGRPSNEDMFGGRNMNADAASDTDSYTSD